MTLLGGYMTTFSGKHFYPLSPDKSMFHLEDMARGLSHENRACGQTTLPMTVAQHSVNVARILRKLGYSTRIQFIGLNHDDSEAYIKDIPSPLKEWLPDYKKVEEEVQRVAYEWAGLGIVTEEEYAPVHMVDKMVFPVEAKFFMPQARHEIDPRLADMVIEPWSPSKAREVFKREFLFLEGRLRRGKQFTPSSNR